MKKKLLGYFYTGTTAFAALLIILIIAVILFDIFRGGLAKLSWEFLTAPPREGMTAGGIFPAIYGTFILVILMSILVLPFGIITAIYLSEYTSSQNRFARMVRFAISNLASVPSIVFGLFGLGFFVQFVGAGLDRLLVPDDEVIWGKPALIWAAATLAILTLPVVIVAVEEALRSVPKEYREASHALGATKWQTVWHTVLPNAVSGILTGAILAISRGAGEVAPLLFTGAAFFLPKLPNSLDDQFMHLGYHLYVMSTQSVNVELTLPIQYGTTLVLLSLTFALNLTAVLIRYRLRKKL
ncbi:MAG: phosphate ABC transporter permease PstA [Candidatus Thermochlorobacter aerophilum]|jgi:phosphate transport system permease protein|uniref:Phosphate transport system permease protein PstA n=1 Tax=Candidatus Thermochlorobacter aerophilus TaxID=1868324 RepID=A0A395M5Z0_9BACT|nr:MAG: phosphate ABC transporter permease PstA [Candidatus Thermochlorobacter aerophilum]RFM25515.1 MAG: phosphate ABC transporter permease PstA [Candidatus Thermochlorobacter aerophilum]